jgi:type IV pilus assembly protein PilB
VKLLGQVLIDEGILDRQQLELGLDEQKRTGELLGNVLLRLGVMTRKELAKAMAFASDLPFVDLKQTQIDQEAVSLVPSDLAKKFKLIPFAFRDDRLQVAMDNPTDVMAIDTLRRRTRKNIDVWAADLESVMESIHLFYDVGTSIDDEVDKNVAAASGEPWPKARWRPPSFA